MYCSNCGAELNENSPVCLRCGAKVESAYKFGKAVSAGYVTAAAVIFLILGLVLGTGGSWFYWKQKVKSTSPDSLATAMADSTNQISPNGVTPLGTPVNQNQEDDLTRTTDNIFEANLHTLSGELQNYSYQVLQYWKTPTSQGGAGQQLSSLNSYDLALYIGFTNENPPKSFSTDSGTYVIDNISNGIVTLKGVGRVKKSGLFPLVTTRVELNSGNITSQAGLAGGL